jgi:hypothetical protein
MYPIIARPPVLSLSLLISTVMSNVLLYRFTHVKQTSYVVLDRVSTVRVQFRVKREMRNERGVLQFLLFYMTGLLLLSYSTTRGKVASR